MYRYSLKSPASQLNVAAIVICLLAAGCNQRVHRVEPDIAQRTLSDVLESWQRGESPESWQAREPTVVVQDFDWKFGARLLSFEVLDTKAVDANLHCRVKLTLSTDKGKKERTVTYLVAGQSHVNCWNNWQ